MRRFSALLIVLSLALMAATAVAGVYRWVGPDGTVHYTDSPPPEGAKQLSMDSTPTDPGEVAKRNNARDRQLQQYREKRQKKEAEKAEAEKKQQQREKACRQAKQRVQKLVSIDRLRLNKPNGETKYLSGEDLAAHKKKMRERAEKLCARVDG